MAPLVWRVTGLPTNSREAALADCAARCAAGEPAVVYDWTNASQVTE